MNWSSGLEWLVALAGQPRKHTLDDDHGDMGTAFGLDASLLPADSAAGALRGGALSQPAIPWEHRLIRRTSL